MVDKSWVLNSYWHDDDWAKWKIEETDEWEEWKAQEIQDISDEEEIEVESKKPVILQIKPKKRPSPPTIPAPAHLVETHAKSVPEMMQDQLPPEPPAAVAPPPKKRKATMGVGDPLPPGRIEPEPRVPRTIPPRVSSCSWMETDGATEVRATWSVRRFGDRDREIEEQEKEQGNETMWDDREPVQCAEVMEMNRFCANDVQSWTRVKKSTSLLPKIHVSMIHAWGMIIPIE